MTRAVIFDLGGVVVPFRFSAADTPRVASALRLSIDIFQRSVLNVLVYSLETGPTNPGPSSTSLAERSTCASPSKNSCELWQAIFLPGLADSATLFDAPRRSRWSRFFHTNELHFRRVQAQLSVNRHLSPPGSLL